MKTYKELRQETIDAINSFNQCYPNHKESEVPQMTGALDWSGTTETNIVEDEERRID